MKAVIYSRVSTDEQTTGNQIPVLKNWASQLRLNLWDLNAPGVNTYCNSAPMEVIRVYSEEETAWKNGYQRELSRLLVDASRGQFQVVLVWALDRLTRQGIMAQFELMAKLARFGVLVYSYQEPWTLTPTKAEYDLLLAIAAYVAQGSSKRNSERTKAGISRKRQEGFIWGRPKDSKDKKKRKRRGK